MEWGLAGPDGSVVPSEAPKPIEPKSVSARGLAQIAEMERAADAIERAAGKSSMIQTLDVMTYEPDEGVIRQALSGR